LTRKTQPPSAEKQVEPADLVPLGAALGAFGVHGEVKVRPFTQTPDGVCAYGPLYDAQGALVLNPRSWRPIKDGLAVRAPESPDRDAAEKLNGVLLHVPRARLPAAGDEEYYHADLIGCRVEAVDGALLGEVVAVQNFGAADLLEVRGPGGMLFLEFSKEEVPVVDIAGRRLIAQPIVPEEAGPRE
jgi:16S rRNA processing protein RimM